MGLRAFVVDPRSLRYPLSATSADTSVHDKGDEHYEHVRKTRNFAKQCIIGLQASVLRANATATISKYKTRYKQSFAAK